MAEGAKETLADARKRWFYRRIMAFASWGSLTAMLGYLTVYGKDDNAVQMMLAQALPVALVGVVLTYIGGPVAEDIMKFQINKS